MLVNRDTKACFVRTTPSALSKLTGYLSYWSSLLTNIKKQIIPKRERSGPESVTYIPRTSVLVTESDNINCSWQLILFDSVEAIDDNGAIVIRPLQRLVTGLPADSGIHQDMLNFRDIGQTAYKHYVEHHYLGNPSTARSEHRRKNLRHEGEEEETDKQKKLVQTCIKETLAFSLSSGQQLHAGQTSSLTFLERLLTPMRCLVREWWPTTGLVIQWCYTVISSNTTPSRDWRYRWHVYHQ